MNLKYISINSKDVWCFNFLKPLELTFHFDWWGSYIFRWNKMLFLQTERLLDVFILCTRTSHRGRGIAGQLVKTAMESARSEGLTTAVSMGLSNYSQRIFRKMGFVEQNCIEYSDYTQVLHHCGFYKKNRSTNRQIYKRNAASHQWMCWVLGNSSVHRQFRDWIFELRIILLDVERK